MSRPQIAIEHAAGYHSYHQRHKQVVELNKVVVVVRTAGSGTA